MQPRTQTLEELAARYVLDKSLSTRCHDYIPAYATLFEPVRYSARHVLEIGIGCVEAGQMSGVVPLGYRTGNSLRCWRDYFANARIIGIDIFPVVLPEKRIRTYVADQSSDTQLDAVLADIGAKLDVIIDDGSHVGEHQAFTFMHLERHLMPRGIYVIEDIQPESVVPFQDLTIFPASHRALIREHYEVYYFDTRPILDRADDFMVAFMRKPC